MKILKKCLACKIPHAQVLTLKTMTVKGVMCLFLAFVYQFIIIIKWCYEFYKTWLSIPMQMFKLRSLILRVDGLRVEAWLYF